MKLLTPVVGAAVLAAAALAFGVAARGAADGPADVPGAAPEGPVVVELFTSEGCSSCPPADEYLSELTKAGQSQGVPVVTLSEHVDYWDWLGWKDPFSSSSFTDRQTWYSDHLESEVYTPQMVVDGQFQAIGSDRDQAAALIARAGAAKKARVSGELTHAPGAVAVHAVVEPGGLDRLPDLDVFVALVEGGLASDVTAGENAGRRLAHAAVTRQLEKAGTVKGGAPSAHVDVELKLNPSWAIDHSAVVVFVQARKGGAIVGAWRSPIDH